MVDSNLDASRPRPRRPRPAASVQKQATDTIFKGLDRFGLAPILLLGLAYIGHTQVVQPIAAAYSKMVSQVGDTNEMLRKAVEENNREDVERVGMISSAQAANRAIAEENRALNGRILEAIARADTERKELRDAIDRADEERKKIHGETQAVLERVLKVLEK